MYRNGKTEGKAMEDRKELFEKELDQISGGDTAEGYKWVFVIKKSKCNGCGKCIEVCPKGAIYMSGRTAEIDPNVCGPCGGECRSACPTYAPYSKCIRA